MHAWTLRVGVILLLGLLLAACGESDAPATPVSLPTVTGLPTSVPGPATPLPTATAVDPDGYPPPPPPPPTEPPLGYPTQAPPPTLDPYP